MAAGATYEPIATNTLGTATTSVTFSSIPATYTDLKIVCVGLIAGSGGFWGFRFNGDTATNYSMTFLSGNGSTPTSSRLTSNNSGYMNFAGSFNTPITMGILDVFNYAGSTNKTALVTFSGDKNGSGLVERGVNLWRNTAAITSATIQTDTGENFTVGTTFTLYGIKAA